MSRFRTTTHGRTNFASAYKYSLIVAATTFGLGEAITMLIPNVGSRWVLSAVFMLLVWSITHVALFILIGGPITWIAILLIDEYFPLKWLNSTLLNTLIGGMLGVLFSPICLLPFLPFRDPDDPSSLDRWTHYLPLMICAGLLGAYCFGSLIKKRLVGISRDQPVPYGN